MNAFAWRLRGFFSLCMVWAGLLTPIRILAADNDAATAAAAKQADEAVREALQREVYGLDTDREQLLSSALKSSPENAAAHWHQGYVRSSTGEWIKADDRSNKKRQALLNHYEKLRTEHADTAPQQLALADWCAKQGLKEQERVHLLRVCELVPDHFSARQRLNFARVGNEWVSREELLKNQARQAAAQKAFVEWTPVIGKIADLLAAKDLKKRELGKQQLQQIHDPAALPAMQAALGNRGEEFELLVVETTAQMTDPSAAVALARHAVFSPSLKVRTTAATKLQSCQPDNFVPVLVSSMFTPVISQIAEIALPRGRVGYRHAFLREGAERQELLILDTQYRRVAAPGGNPLQSLITATEDARLTAETMERAVAAQNAATTALNDRIGWALSQSTGTQLPAVPEDWWKWWNDQNEVFVQGSKPIATIQQSRTISIVERSSGIGSGPTGGGSASTSGGGGRSDCLAAGTPVWTERGEIDIEKVRIGDLVLSRDVESGELAFKPVLRTTIRPESPLVKIQAGSEVFETSGGHLFWVSGQGWIKSRKLETGMVLHTANGPARVTQISDSPAQPTYNLVVADFNTYFVGKQKVLSHDNTVRRVTNVVVPGLKPE